MSPIRPTSVRHPTAWAPIRLSTGITLLAVVTIAAAWAFEWAGYAPCELCLKERIPYYAGVPLGAVAIWLAYRSRWSLLPAAFAALALIFAAGAALAIYHAGVEWHLWAGPASCTGSVNAPAKVEDFLQQLQTANVVRCDAAALRIGGLSLSGWDAIVCLTLTGLAVGGFAHTSRGRPEQTLSH